MRLKGIPCIIMDSLKSLDQKKTYICELREEKSKRTLDQNAYYWELIDKYADYEKISKNEMHRRMIADYGQRMGDKAIPRLTTYDYLKETDNIYLRPTHKYFQDDKGIEWQWYFICRGSSEYNTKEMSILIDGLIQDIEGSEADIDVLSPNERERMWGAWL